MDFEQMGQAWAEHEVMKQVIGWFAICSGLFAAWLVYLLVF